MRILLCLLAACAAYGQSPAFEVASIKPTPRPEGGGMRVGTTGGPGTKDPGRWTCENMSFSNLVSMAFELKAFELNAPAWTNDERFNINAKVPEGATKEMFRAMLQNLLIERFGLRVHRESKEMQGFELVVMKGGPKFKESEPEPPKEAGSDQAARPPAPMMRPSIGKDGFPVMPPGASGTIMMNGRARQQWMRQPMESIARNLSYQAGKPVSDATGLKGNYDVSLYWLTESLGAAPPPPPEAGPGAPEVSGPNLFTALQEQLGLKLEPRKVSIQVLVVDQAAKVPTEN
jgi:uncharacterized protein (TIGR03435 family)